MTRRVFVCAAAALGVMVSTSRAQEARQQSRGAPPSASVAELRSHIEKSWQEFAKEHIAGHAAAATKAFFTEDAVNVTPGNPESVSRAAIEAFFAKFYSTTKVLSIDRATDEVDLSGKLAYERGHFTQVTQADQKAPQALKGRYLAIWRQQPDRTWKCSRFYFNWAP